MKYLIIFLIALSFISCTKSVKSSKPDEVINAEKYVKKYMEEKNLPGCAAAVVKNDKLLWADAFGFANTELKVDADTITKFRVASISKLLVAALVARLHQSGAVDIDIPVSKLVKDFPKKKSDFTIRDLVSHAAGIRSYKKDDDKSLHNSIENGVKIFINDPLLHKPGSKYKYSTYGYCLLSYVLEEALDTPFEKLLTDSLLTPLNMTNTVVDDPYKLIDSRAAAYVGRSDNKIYNAPFQDNRYKVAGGGIITSIGDLSRFAKAILKNNYLNKNTRQMLFTNYSFSEDKRTDIGFGWQLKEDKNGEKFVGHFAGNPGGGGVFILYPDKNIATIIIGNRNTLWRFEQATTIAGYFMESE